MKGGPRLIDIATIRSLPRSTTTWEMSLRDAPAEADRARMYRLLIIVSPGANTIRLMRATTDRALPPAALVEALEHAMTQTEGDLVPARPPAVLVDSEELFDAIRLPMESCGVEVRLQGVLPAIDPVIEALGQKPGLFSERTLIGTSCFEAELAEAAARVASREPWRYFVHELPLAVSVGDGPPHILVVIGTTGVCAGVAAYHDEASYRAATAFTSAERTAGGPIPFDGWVLLFDPASATRPALRRAIAQRGLPVAHALYPHYKKFSAGEPPLELTDRHEARRVEHMLHALAGLIDEHGDALLDGTWERSRHELPGGPMQIEARPDLGTSRTPDDGDDESPFVDEPPLDPSALPRLLPDDHIMLVATVPASSITRVAPELTDALSGDVPCLVIRGTKKCARAAAKSLSQLHGLAFGVRNDRGRDLEIIFGLTTKGLAGVVSVFGATHDQPRLAEELTNAIGDDASHVTVLFSGGGARRPKATFEPADIVAAIRLRLVDWS